MPQIKQFEAGPLALKPSDRATSAAVSAGRSISSSYNDIARSYQNIGNNIGSSFERAGRVALDYIDHEEISRGTAQFAEISSELSQSWDNSLKGADPNDPSVGAAFRESIEAPLAKWVDTFTTEKAQRWAEDQAAKLREHFFKTTASDQSTLAVIAMRQNLMTLGNQYSNMVASDPASLDFVLEQTDTSLRAIVDSSPTLSPEARLKVTSEVAQQIKESVARSAVTAAIARNPDAGLKMAQNPKYAGYLNGGEVNNFYAEAKRAERSDATNARLEAERVRRETSEANTDRIVTELYSRGNVTMKDVLQIPPSDITRQDREHLLNIIEKREAGPPEAVAKRNAVDLIVKIQEGKITDTAPLYNALGAGEIDYSRFKEVQSELVAMRSDQGQTLTNARGDFMRQYLPIVNPNDPIRGQSEDGYRRAYQLQQYARIREDEMRQAGRDPHSLYDPRSPDFIGNTPFSRPTSSSDMLQNLKRSGESGLAPAKGPNPGDVVKGYKFKGGDPSKAENWEKR